jgi:hypothetical protein
MKNKGKKWSQLEFKLTLICTSQGGPAHRASQMRLDHVGLDVRSGDPILRGGHDASRNIREVFLTYFR